jgi:hypothetical protein
VGEDLVQGVGSVYFSGSYRVGGVGNCTSHTYTRGRKRHPSTNGIGNLEQLARKAQMNPHFIFNSLNSIQQYVMDSDLAGANKFISGFSRLIRQTLDFSSRQEISLEEELDYLRNYLELEKTRLEDAFSWQVIMEDTINRLTIICHLWYCNHLSRTASGMDCVIEKTQKVNYSSVLK